MCGGVVIVGYVDTILWRCLGHGGGGIEPGGLLVQLTG